MDPLLKNCRACGAAYPLDVEICPRCLVPRKGDVNKPATVAYGFFLLIMLILAVGTLWYLGKPH